MIAKEGSKNAIEMLKYQMTLYLFALIWLICWSTDNPTASMSSSGSFESLWYIISAKWRARVLSLCFLKWLSLTTFASSSIHGLTPACGRFRPFLCGVASVPSLDPVEATWTSSLMGVVSLPPEALPPGEITWMRSSSLMCLPIHVKLLFIVYWK